MSGAGLTLPATGGGISDATVAFAAELIDRSGKAPVIEAALAHATGRRRPLPVRAVLTALLCLALDDRPLFLTEATRLLFCQLSPASRRLLKVTGAVTTQRAFLAAYRRVRYCFGAICSVMDPSALPKNRRLIQADLTARTRPMTRAQAEAARGRLEAFINALLEASISALTDAERAASDGSAGLDATPVPLFSRGPSKRTGLCASDPDGGWYVREGDHREREDDKGKPLRKIAWALEATIATTARLPGTAPACPDLAIGLALARPGEDPGGTGIRVLASVAARGHQPGPLGYDRAYTPALPERFALPARALGYQPVMDYRADQLGIQANTGGAILVEGTWYCPALPGPLITATTRLRDHAISPDPLRPADHRPPPLPAQTQRRPRRRRLPAAVLPGPQHPPRHHVPAARTITVTPRRTAQGTPAPARTTQALPPDRDHHRHRTPAPATARTCPTAAPPGTRPTPPCATPSRASTATPKTPPTRPSPSPPGAASAASPPSRSSPRCCSWPPTSARSAPGGPSPPATRPASPAGHGDAGPACATTTPTADTPQHPPPPLIIFTHRAATLQSRQNALNPAARAAE